MINIELRDVLNILIEPQVRNINWKVEEILYSHLLPQDAFYAYSVYEDAVEEFAIDLAIALEKIIINNITKGSFQDE